MNTGDKTSGGEGGIRTLGTGVSPYNGLANGSSLAALTRFKDLQSDSGPPSRAQGFSFGSYCAPLCAPLSDSAMNALLKPIRKLDAPGAFPAYILHGV